MNNPEWAELALQLQEPFYPADVEFRPQGALTDKGRGRAIAYVDARVVAERLDHVFGPLGWNFTWDPLIQDSVVRVVRGVITINGVSKSDIGDGDQTEVSKAAVSDALKRTAVLFGVGRYLYTLPAEWVDGKPMGKGWVIPDEELARLRQKLPRPKGMEPPPQRPPAQPNASARPPARENGQGRTTPATNGAPGVSEASAGNRHESAPDPARPWQPSHEPDPDAAARIQAAKGRVGAAIRQIQGQAPDTKLTIGAINGEFASHVKAGGFHDTNYNNASVEQWERLADLLTAEAASQPAGALV